MVCTSETVEERTEYGCWVQRCDHANDKENIDHSIK